MRPLALPPLIESGIFRGGGDALSLSPVLFFLALSTLSFVSNLTTCGYDIMNGTINHLVDVDALKTFAENSEQQTRLLSTLRTFSNGIKMKLSLQNWANKTVRR